MPARKNRRTRRHYAVLRAVRAGADSYAEIRRRAGIGAHETVVQDCAKLETLKLIAVVEKPAGSRDDFVRIRLTSEGTEVLEKGMDELERREHPNGDTEE